MSISSGAELALSVTVACVTPAPLLLAIHTWPRFAPTPAFIGPAIEVYVLTPSLTVAVVEAPPQEAITKMASPVGTVAPT